MSRFSLARTVASAVCFAIAVAAAAQAAGGPGEVTAYKARFSSHQAGAATGLHLLTKGNAPAEGTTEPPAYGQTVVLPAGTRLDLGALPQCDATDEAIGHQGAEGACPARTRVGEGSADGLLNGQPVHFDVGIYAVRGHLVFAAERDGVPLKQSFKGIASGRKLKLAVPTLNGTIAPTRFEARIPAHAATGTWLRTPAKCPRSGHWTSRGVFQGRTAAEGGQPTGPRQVRTDKQRCAAS
jgi:hypothetical protein